MKEAKNTIKITNVEDAITRFKESLQPIIADATEETRDQIQGILEVAEIDQTIRDANKRRKLYYKFKKMVHGVKEKTNKVTQMEGAILFMD